LLIIAQSLAVIILAPVFPSLVSPVPPQATSPLGEPLATSSPHPRRSHSLRRRNPAPPATVTVSVRRDPTILPIIERPEQGSSHRSAPPVRRVSFSPQSSSTSVPTLADMPSQPGSSTGHSAGGPSTPAMRRVLETESDIGAAYIVSSEGDDTETLGVDELGNAIPSLCKRSRRSFPFTKKKRSKEAVREGDEDAGGMFRNRRRTQSLGDTVEAGAGGSGPDPLCSRKRSSWLSQSSAHEDALRESEEAETDRASRTSATEKEARRRSGLSFQDFKAAFGKREWRGPGSSPTPEGTGSRLPRTGTGIGLGKPSTSNVHVSPRSASDELVRTKRARSPPLILDTAATELISTERREVQSPLTIRSQPPKPHAGSPPLFGGEVVIRNESGRRRTRSSAIPGLYTDAEVVRRW
jgi:hypothetical protein